MFPGSGKFTDCETSVDEIEGEITDSIERQLAGAGGDIVRTREGFHGKGNGSEALGR